MQPKVSEKLGPESWVQRALATLLEAGIEQVRVERLAKDLGVTKGSFYWHFRDRQHLLDELLEYWFRTMTEEVFEVARGVQGSARERLHAALADIMTQNRAGYDLAVRAWARLDPKAAQAVRRIDDKRLEFLCGLLVDTGLEQVEAGHRARLLYDYVLGEAMAFNRQPVGERLRTVERVVDVLAGR